jgi:ppGpp synthetase/RelA/SpoT-type nucleotidyltranferase
MIYLVLGALLENNKHHLITEFEKELKQYENFSDKMNILIKELLEQENISYHSIENRVKEKNSLEKKIDGKNKYQNLSEITDIVGCRIISYFEIDVEKIVALLFKEFKIDEVNSIDKKKILDPDRFGYLSYHIICSINDERAQLREYKNYKDLKFEIQVRTILQHAWAEIEHDIGYKSNIAVPREFRRKFSRIASILEIADDEFSRLKLDIHNYVETISKQGFENTDINAESLKLFIEKSSDLEEIETYVIETLKLKNVAFSEQMQEAIISFTLNIINKFTAYKEILEIQNSIRKNKELIKQFIVKWAQLRVMLLDRFQKHFDQKDGLIIGYALMMEFVETNHNEGLKAFFPDVSLQEKDEAVALAMKLYQEITSH